MAWKNDLDTFFFFWKACLRSCNLHMLTCSRKGRWLEFYLSNNGHRDTRSIIFQWLPLCFYSVTLSMLTGHIPVIWNTYTSWNASTGQWTYITSQTSAVRTLGICYSLSKFQDYDPLLFAMITCPTNRSLKCMCLILLGSQSNGCFLFLLFFIVRCFKDWQVCVNHCNKQQIKTGTV